jgi:hypothetical protein
MVRDAGRREYQQDQGWGWQPAAASTGRFLAAKRVCRMGKQGRLWSMVAVCLTRAQGPARARLAVGRCGAQAGSVGQRDAHPPAAPPRAPASCVSISTCTLSRASVCTLRPALTGARSAQYSVGAAAGGVAVSANWRRREGQRGSAPASRHQQPGLGHP